MKAITPKQHAFLARCIDHARAAIAGGQHRSAIGWCRKALQLAPDMPEAWYSLGLAHSGLRQVSEATDALLRASALTQDNPDAQNSIGLQLFQVGADTDAEQCLRHCIALAPNFAFAHSNLGLLCMKQNRLDEAAASFRKAIESQPRLAGAHANLGATLNAQKNYAAGEAACRRALEIDSKLAVAWSNLGSALHGLKRYESAVAAARTATGLDPQFADAWSNLGNSLFGLSRTDEAEAACRTALLLDPALPDPHAVMAGILVARGAYEEALGEFETSLTKGPHDSAVLSTRLYCLNFVPGLSPTRMLSAASEYETVASRNVNPFTSWRCDPDQARKLRIGMVSGDFRSHPVGYFLRGPLRELNKTEFEIVAYSSHSQRDELSEELERHCAAWIDVVGMSDAELARQIHRDQIDILIDLSGHTDHNRLTAFVWKPAPVQVTWLGYFATTGIRAIDWKIGDPWVTPVQEESHFAERIWRLPDSCFCSSPPRDAPEVAELPCRVNGFVTYGCFNNLTKVNDAVIDVWSRILQSDAKSRLFLKSKPLAGKELRQALVARFERHGIAQDRLILEGSSAYADYLAAYGRVDIALDPFPYPGGMTTSESLWMGVPVVTLKGDRFIGHQGESLLNAAGLPGWVASSGKEYVDIALGAASAREALATARAGMRAMLRQSPLFDAPRFARHLESACRGMWREWCVANR